jgi:DNA-binding transcriptional ArsR family regulator
MAKKATKSKAAKFSKAEVSEIASVLHVIASVQRLILFIEMIRSGEATVTSFAKAAGLSQSAASQHLGKSATQASFHFDVMDRPFGTGLRMPVFKILSKLLTESFADVARIHHVTDPR